MPVLDPAYAYLRKQCGMPARHRDLVVIPDPDDPALRELTTAQAALAARVSDATIRKWAERKLIVPVNPGEATPRYLELDVLRAEADTRRAPRARQLAQEAAKIVQ